MIDKVYGKHILICDICGEYEAGENEEGFDTFAEAVQAKRELGWTSKRDKTGVWLEICSECKELK